MATTILRENPRFQTASRTRNSRFPSSSAELVGRVEYCYDAEDVALSLQKTIDAGLRPTVRCSGHCYEDFVVNNPNGAILDLSMLSGVGTGPEGTAPYSLKPGTMLGNAYEQFYKLAGVTLPAGTCYTVNAGGHISGGGYGTLVRLYGLTVDWVTAMDVVTVDQNGKAIPRRVDKQNDPDLFRALRGGQGSNFGVITGFHFQELPPMPQEVVHGSISWDWKDMTEEKFLTILTTYGKWMEENDQKKETWGLFSGLYLVSKKTGRISVHAEYCVPEGPVKDTSVLTEFLDRFQPCKPTSDAPPQAAKKPQTGERGRPIPPSGDTVCYGERSLERTAWIESTVRNQSGSSIIPDGNHRAKYKSCYMKKNFSEAEARAYYRMLTGETAHGLIIAVDSYGGAANVAARAEDTAIPQRTSVMKIQYQTYWEKPEDDEYRLKGIRDVYEAVYSTDGVDAAHLGTPFPGDRYDGCYINYPDADMLKYDFWPQLYYGTGDLYPFLQEVKKKYDPHNIFHHAMSIRPR